MSKKIAIIGGGFGGLASSCLLAEKGYDVSIYEKNNLLGGRANLLETNGFKFDMGPSWYLMPDVFEHFFSLLGENIKNYIELIKLEPSYQVFFKGIEKNVLVYTEKEKINKLFESFHPGTSKKLAKYLARSEEHYNIAMEKFIYKNYNSLLDFFSIELVKEALKLNLLSNMQSFVSKSFSNEHLQKLLQYQLVFLGNSPYNAPAIYNIMSHVDFNQGVFYPRGGFYELVKAMIKMAKKRGVKLYNNATVKEIITEKNKATGLVLESGENVFADIIISNADIEHTENTLIKGNKNRSYSKKYWQKRVMAPSGFIMYLGIKGKINNLEHHNLIFSPNWKRNFEQIFDKPKWPDDPSIYICAPSRIDESVAPKDHENLFVFVPVASDLDCSSNNIEKFSKQILTTLSQTIKVPNLKERIIYQQFFTGKDFIEKYNSYKGTALGLAHTLLQTAVFRPNNISKKINNLYYVGANTNPGIGLPMCIISAELLYKRIQNINYAGPLEKI
jgi:phytoene desaturase